MFSSASGEYLWKYSLFWWDLLLCKMQKLRGIPNICAASGHWIGALVHQELSRKPGDLDLKLRDQTGLWLIISTTTANYLNFLWVCNQGNGTRGHWWGWLSCFTHGFSCLWWCCGNGCLWPNHTIPVLLGDQKCLFCSRNQSWVFFPWCLSYPCLAAVRWVLTASPWISVFLHSALGSV